MYKHDKEFGNTERAHFKSADLLLRSNKTTNGVKHLADAFMYVGKRRNRTEADEVFQSFKSKYKDQIPWPSAVQRPFVFVPFLHGQPYWDVPPAPLPLQSTPQTEWMRTAQKLQDNFPAIHAEFLEKLKTNTHAGTEPMINGDEILIDRGDNNGNGSTSASGPNFKSQWQRFQICHLGVWDESACATMPSVCNALRNDKGVMGKISKAKVQGINTNGGWSASASPSLKHAITHLGLNPEVVKAPRIQLPELSETGHVPLLEASKRDAHDVQYTVLGTSSHGAHH